MNYKVISRKYRPQNFNEIIGQDHICTTLQNALKSGRIAHAYLFTGSRGIGKTSTARILAKALNCLNPQDYNPCNVCQNCVEITNSRSLDVIEIDGASNRGIDQVRELRENVKYPPSNSKYRIFIIDEVHMLTREAFNALLKTLEEPPPHVVFIFATTEPLKVPPTIISRCQRYDFHRIPVREIVGQLKKIAESENLTVSDDILTLLAKKSEGAMRDAESLLEQVVSFSSDNVNLNSVQKLLGLTDYEYYFTISNQVFEHDLNALIKSAEEVFNNGVNISEFLIGLSEHFRNLLITAIVKSAADLDLPDSLKNHYQEEAQRWSVNDLMRLLKLVGEAQAGLKAAMNQRTHLEFAL
ncbi:MAG TPA: DNA polymerase III subunit gamma/tau, partial [Candidatus Marinimicrobia bacterium]|nr:DNA polymerase III subunit gamma/tau [Candidatus Neomarinimicrobiota bacterium]